MSGGRAVSAAGLLLATMALADAPHSALDCRRGAGECRVRPLEWTVTNCAPEWGGPCEKTQEGLADVHFVADAQNHVRAPFTRERFRVERFEVGLVHPWDLEPLPDGSWLVTERGGRIVHIQGATARGVHDLSPVQRIQTGLLGLAVDPAFAENRFVYVYYTTELATRRQRQRRHRNERQVRNRIARFRFDGEALRDERLLLDAIPGSAANSGGRLEFGPDGRLYATTGDASRPELAQDPRSLAGKILRLEGDGRIPADNPSPGSPVYALGLRNAQGLAWQPGSGALFAGDHGASRHDEINRVPPGANLGWGHFRCDEARTPTPPPRAAFRFPLRCFTRYTLAPSGMHFVDDPGSPWHGDLFVASLRGRHLHRFRLEGDRIVGDEIFYVAEGRPYETVVHGDPSGRGMHLRIRDVEWADGALLVVGERFGLVRLVPLREE